MDKRKSEEMKLKQDIRLALAKLDPMSASWNNPVGFDEKLKIKYGLQPGSSDLICCVQGRFTALEVKDLGRPQRNQVLFINNVNRMGGYGCFVRSVEEAIEAYIASASGDRLPQLEVPPEKKRKKR